MIENLWIADLSSSKYRLHIPWARVRLKASRIFSQYGVAINPSALVSKLKPVECAMLAIVRAVEEMRAEEQAHDRKGLLVLDEPTVFLPKADVDRLFALVREIVGGGDSVLFVSHDLDEVRDITDRVTVLRDGRNAGTVVTSDATEGALVELIIGRRLTSLAMDHDDRGETAVHTRVRDLSGGRLSGLSFEVHEGEVVGLTGLVGSGFEEVPYFLFGAAKPQSGRLDLAGNDLDLAQMSPSRAVALGIALVPADRQRDGAVGSLPVVDNMNLQILDEFFNSIWLDRRRMKTRTAGLMKTYDIRPRRPGLIYGSLSGGNQQKSLLAKWMQIDPTLLLLHEPTQGVDIGARQQIFKLLREVSGRGTSVICASSDYEQLAAVCDRVLIFGRGRITQQLNGAEVTKERITEQCYNSVPF